MEIIIIAAMAANRVIGHNNRLPWSLPEDLRLFKEKTLGHALIMGRKTYESLGRPLEGRLNIVLTRHGELTFKGCLVAPTLKQALSLCQGRQKAFIIGGGQIFKLGLTVADTLILTVLERECKGDTIFPDFSNQGFIETKRDHFNTDEPFSVITYRRVGNTNQKKLISSCVTSEG